MMTRVSTNLASLFPFLAAAMPVLIIDAAGLAGIGLVIYGVWVIYAPAGFIVAGILLIAGAMYLARAPIRDDLLARAAPPGSGA
jgi:hypothetical protein